MNESNKVSHDLKDGDFVFYPSQNESGEVKGNKVYWSDSVITELNYTKQLLSNGDLRYATEKEIAAHKANKTNVKLEKILKELNGYEITSLKNKLKSY